MNAGLKIGYRTVGFTGWSIEDALRTVADAGYEAVEICLEHPDLTPFRLTADLVARVRKVLDETGLALAAISYHGLDDQLEDRRQITYAAIDLLGHFGAQVFVVASRREEPARLPAQWSEAIDLYRELADRCAEQGCRLAVEPQPGLVVRNAEDLVKILRECGHPHLAGNLDIAHASITADDLSWAIFQLGPRLVNVHVADVGNGVHQHLIPGEGRIDFAEVREVLESVGYGGAVVIDIPRPAGPPDEVCRSALTAFRERWGA